MEGQMDKHREVRTMKRRPKRPTDEQAMLIAKAGLMARDWLVLWESGSRMCLVHRGNGKTRRIEI
jgi:hypothetical protein